MQFNAGEAIERKERDKTHTQDVNLNHIFNKK